MMLRTLLTFLAIFLCVSCFLLEDQKPTSDHDLIRYLDNVVTNLVNLTGKLGTDIATKNDLTQFLQSDLQQLNLTLQEEKQKRQTLETKVTQLETRLVIMANVHIFRRNTTVIFIFSILSKWSYNLNGKD